MPISTTKNPPWYISWVSLHAPATSVIFQVILFRILLANDGAPIIYNRQWTQWNFLFSRKKHEKVTNPLSDGQEHVDFAIFANAYLKVCSRFRDFQSSNKKKAFIGFLLRQQFWFRSMARGRPRGQWVYRSNSLGTEETEGTVSKQASRWRPVYGPKLGSCQTTS